VSASVRANASASILDCNPVSAVNLIVPSLPIAKFKEPSKVSILVFRVDSADKALFSSARTAAALAVASESILV
jgi:hypothetical protein